MTAEHSGTPRRPWLWRLLVLAILAAGVAAFAALIALRPRPAVRPPAVQLPLVRVAPVEFRTDPIVVTGNGLVRPRAEVTLAAEVSGRVVYVSPALVTGGAFARGDVLLRLDEEPFRAALAQAVADRNAAQAALKLATQLLERTEELIRQSFLPRQTLDERTAARDQARAALARAEALERSRRLDLDRAVVHAPFRGRVLSEKVDPGETVQPGKELARIFADDIVEITVSLTDRDVALIAAPWDRGSSRNPPGAPATVSVEHGGARYAWAGRVDRMEGAVDSATRTFNVVVRVADPSARGRRVNGETADGPPLLVGMYATVAITGRDIGRYALVPRRALRDESSLWLLGAGDKVVVQPVRMIHETAERAAVTAGALADDARVIVSDLKVVTQGMPVRVVTTAPQRARADGTP